MLVDGGYAGYAWLKSCIMLVVALRSFEPVFYKLLNSEMLSTNHFSFLSHYEV